MSKKLQKSFTLSDHHSKNTVRILLAALKIRYKEVHRIANRLYSKNEEWLKFSVNFSYEPESDSDIEKNKNENVEQGRRRSKTFSDSSDTTKRRRTISVRNTMSFEELFYAFKMKAREEKKNDIVKYLNDVENDENASKIYRELYEDKDKKPIVLTPDEAVSFLISQQLSSRQYKACRALVKNHNADIFPTYQTVLEAKEKCYPEGIVATETVGEIKLQELLNHTASRIIEYQEEVIEAVNPEKLEHVTLYCKCGMDGCSGFSPHQQGFSDDPDCIKSDESIFYIALSPIQLDCQRAENEVPLVLWHNFKTGSPKFCRPVKILLAKETADLSRTERDLLQDQINQLQPFETTVHEKKIVVNFKLRLSMIDGKTTDALTDNKSTLTCTICKESISQFNNIDDISKKEITKDHLQYGIPILHAWIRCFELVLHIAYNLDFKKWKALGENKLIKEERKKKIQKDLKSALGITVDKVKQGGAGNTNDGNTARRFFANISVVAKITGVNEELLKRFHVILQVLNSGLSINEEAFEKYCLDTARLYVKEYPWYHMPPAVHKILIHGTQIINAVDLPIGLFSEDAQESSNKFLKIFRKDYSRRGNRQHAMLDILQRLCVNSDPLISSKTDKKIKKQNFSKEVIDMLLASSPSSNDSSTTSSPDLSLISISKEVNNTLTATNSFHSSSPLPPASPDISDDELKFDESEDECVFDE